MLDKYDESNNMTNRLDLMRLPINIKNVRTLALVDSGSAASLIALSVFNQLPNNYRKGIIENSESEVCFRSLSGKIMHH